MRIVAALILAALLSGCASLKGDSASEQVGWRWLIQYSYIAPVGGGLADRVLVQMHDDGSVQYIRQDALFNFGGAAWRRELKTSPREVVVVKKKIETILSVSVKNQRKQDEKSEFDAHITVRTAEELVEAWGDNRFSGAPLAQAKKVFRNLRLLDDETHKKIQEVFKQFNAEAEKLTWKWE